MEGSLPLAGGSDGCDDRNRQARNDRVPGSTNSTVENISITQTPFPTTSPLVSDDWHTSLPDTAHVRFFKSVDWTKSVLGPLQSWCVSLRLHTFTLFADSQASCVYWGPQRVAIYNEGFAPLAGKAHPALMGSTFAQGFPEIWPVFRSSFDDAEAAGVAIDVNEQEMYVARNSFFEETYFTGNFVPIRGDTGAVEGFYNRVHEVTRAKIGERRRQMLDRMRMPSLDTRRLADHILPALQSNPRDIPLALLYRLGEETEPDSRILNLRGSIGIPEGHQLHTKSVDLDKSDEGLVPLLRESRSKIITIAVDDKFDGVEWQGFGEPSKVVSILPLWDADRLFGFLVTGSNPRRPIDEDHHQFLRDLSVQVCSVAASIITTADAKKRAEQLKQKLEERQKRVDFMAQHASVGMCYINQDGRISWANDEYWDSTGHPRGEEEQYNLSWLGVILDDDRPKALATWNRLRNGERVTAELRLKKKYIPPSGDPEPATLLLNGFPTFEKDVVTSVNCFTTDISNLKWAQAVEARNTAEALEAKQKQEEFIDLVSHELRNPLSAIFQLADSIINSSPMLGGTNTTEADMVNTIKSNIENASTILMCAKHQKRIVDDVLTLSKLEYTMVSFSPRPIQLSILVTQSLKMFEAELLENGIKVKVIRDPEAGEIDWVICDESRVQQVLINLITNAMKFTKTESTRQIEVKYGAVLSAPRRISPDNINWAPNKSGMVDLTLSPEWGLGEPVYLTLTVMDTGVGMSSDEISKLFSRFEQANEKTSIKYGGSGLGLFVSQKLVEKQGGEIGVTSIPGNGSTFAFYVKARCAEAGVEDKRRPQPARSSRSLSSSLPVHSGPRGVDLDKLHVLLVEDNEVNQKIVQKQLVKSGCVVYVANHGIEALEVLRDSDAWHENGVTSPGKHLDIILMDWEMPIMDGLTCAREIRSLQRAGKVTRHVEIIATTANARQEQIQVALSSGIDSVIVKPFMIVDLMAKMRERLSNTLHRLELPRSSTEPS